MIASYIACEDPGFLKMVMSIMNIFNLICIVVPILLLVYLTIDFGKMVISGESDEIAKRKKKIIKRMIACACVFFVPLLVSVTCNMLTDAGLEYTKCISNANKDYINQRLAEEENNRQQTTTTNNNQNTKENKQETKKTEKKETKKKTNKDTNKKIEANFKLKEDYIVIGHFHNSINQKDITILNKNSKKVSSTNYSFESSNPGIVSVDSNGKLTAHFGGKAKIKVWSKKKPDNTQQLEVLVVHPLYTKVKITTNVTLVDLKTGEKKNYPPGTTGVYNGIGHASELNPDTNIYGDTIKIGESYYRLDSKSVKPYEYYITEPYTKEEVETFINSYSVFNSSTNYLFWTSQGTQTGYMFEGKQGNYKLKRSWGVNTGDSANLVNHDGYTSTGIYLNTFVMASKVSSGYPHGQLYKSDISNPWHEYYTGKRYPASHGCTRMPIEDLEYIEKNIDKFRGSRIVDY